MWYNIKWNVFVVDNIPTMLRRLELSVLYQVLMTPLKSLYDKWYNWRVENIYKLEHSGQICYLRGSLNDKFDPILRRIYIGNGQINEPIYIFTEPEERDVWLHTENENETLWLFTDSETADTGLDFIVYVPEEIYKTEIEALRAHIDYYKAGGKKYDILIING